MRKARGRRRIGRIRKFLPLPGFFEIAKQGKGKFDFIKASALRFKGVLKENISTYNFFDLEQEGYYYYQFLRKPLKSEEELILEKEAFWEVLKVINFMSLFSYNARGFAFSWDLAFGLYLLGFKDIACFGPGPVKRFSPCIRVDFNDAVFFEERKVFGRVGAFLKASVFKLELGDNANFVGVWQWGKFKRPRFDATAREINIGFFGYYNLIRLKDKLAAKNFLHYYISLSLFVSIFAEALPHVFGSIDFEKGFFCHSLQVYVLLMEDNEFYEFYVLMHFIKRFVERLYWNHIYSVSLCDRTSLDDLFILEKSGVSLEELLSFVYEILSQKIGIFYEVKEWEGRVYLKVWDCFGRVHIDGLYNF